MDSERWRQIDDLFHLALRLPIDQREAFVNEACGQDEKLLNEVWSLVNNHEENGSFLEKPLASIGTTISVSVAAATAPVDNGLAGRIVSHYQVLGKLGGGGMGVVYQAVDLNLGRGVAIKFLPAEIVMDHAAFGRLQREARAASSLDHPNICAIYELDEYEGRPFIVMQLLKGRTLCQWIERATDQDMPSRLTQTLDLAIQITNGLQAAHQKGIIHRDIKPANIFVTTRDEVKILDFGIAKFLEREAAADFVDEVSGSVPPADNSPEATLTRMGAKVGTASYMSPEQIRGERLDARTDLFSLGLVIYEMITGQRGFGGKDAPAVHDAILYREPTHIRALNSSVPGGLEGIITKALSKDRDRRYTNAQELAADLERLRNQLRAKATRQRSVPLRLAVTVSILVLLLTLSVLILNSYFSRGPLLSSNKLRPSLAVLGFRNLSGNIEDQWVSTALMEMVSIELASGQQLRIIAGEDVARTKLDLALPEAGGYGPDALKRIRKALAADIIVQGSYLRSANKDLQFDVKIQDSRTGRTITADSERGKDSEIGSLVAGAGVHLRQRLGLNPISPEARKETLATLPGNAHAAQYYSEGIAKLRIFDALGARESFVKAIALEPTHALSHSYLAQSLSALGYDAQSQTEAKRAFELCQNLSRDNQLLIEAGYRTLSRDYSAALEIYQALWKFFPENVDYGLKVATSQIAAALPKQALLTIEQLRRLPGANGSDPRIDLADADASESLGDFQRELQIATLAAKKADLQGARFLKARAKVREGWAWDRLGNLDRAFACFAEARDLSQAEGDWRSAAQYSNRQAVALYDKGDLEGARKLYEESLAAARRAGAQASLSAAYNNIGNVFYDEGKLVEARRSYQQGLEIDRLTGDRRGEASELGNLANVLQGTGDLTGAIRMHEDALQVFREVHDRRGEASTLDNLGRALADRGKLEPAKLEFQEALKIVQQTGYRRGRSSVLLSLADVLQAQNRLSEARATIAEAAAISKEDKEEAGIGESELELGKIDLAAGNVKKAEQEELTASEQFKRQGSANLGCLSNAILGRAFLADGNLQAAKIAVASSLALCAQGQDRGAQFESAISNASVTFKTGQRTAALKMLKDVQAAAMRSGYLGYELEAELQLGKIEIESGAISSGTLRLMRLEKKAQTETFAFIAREAQAALSSL